MKSNALSPQQYLAELPQERRSTIAAVRQVILENLPEGYEEAMNYGMIAYQVPLAKYPDTYNKQPFMYAALASQKNHMAVYLMCAYGNPALKQKLLDGFSKAGKKIDMGGSCLRFKKLEDLDLDSVASLIAAVPMEKFIAIGKKVHAK